MAKGQKTGGRQKGTPNKATADVRSLAQMHGPAAIERAARLAGLVDAGDGMAESEQAQIAALSIILDRAYGKPTQPISGDVDNPLTIVHEILGSVDGLTRGLPNGSGADHQSH